MEIVVLMLLVAGFQTITRKDIKNQEIITNIVDRIDKVKEGRKDDMYEYCLQNKLKCMNEHPKIYKKFFEKKMTLEDEEALEDLKFLEKQ